MKYYEDETITIRDMEKEDASIITREEIAQGWHQSEEKYLEHLKDQKDGKCLSLVALYYGDIAGYINLYFNARSGPFMKMRIPEIADFGVLEKKRNLGIGSKLMDVAEEVASKYAKTVCLGVGLHEGYGIAQQMYVKRGYIPDGTGVWYKDKKCEPYSSYINDDDLVLYMSKKL